MFHLYCAWGGEFLGLASLWSTNNQWLGSRQPLRNVARFVAPCTPAEERLPRHASVCLCHKCILRLGLPPRLFMQRPAVQPPFNYTLKQLHCPQSLIHLQTTILSILLTLCIHLLYTLAQAVDYTASLKSINIIFFLQPLQFITDPSSYFTISCFLPLTRQYPFWNFQSLTNTLPVNSSIHRWLKENNMELVIHIASFHTCLLLILLPIHSLFCRISRHFLTPSSLSFTTDFFWHLYSYTSHYIPG